MNSFTQKTSEICYNCDIDYKLQYCCGSNPETGEMSEINTIDGRILGACPSLDESGDCTNYENRPGACSTYECPKLENIDLFELLQ